MLLMTWKALRGGKAKTIQSSLLTFIKAPKVEKRQERTAYVYHINFFFIETDTVPSVVLTYIHTYIHTMATHGDSTRTNKHETKTPLEPSR